MKKSLIAAGLALIMLAGCGGKKKGEGSFPENFGTIGDAGRVEYMMRNVSPDSLAGFIIYGSLGKVEGARIDTLAIATSYAYDHLKGEALDQFGARYDAIANTLQLADKMKIYAQAGIEDPQGLGYRLGLEYLSTIRDNHLDVKAIKQELEAFRKACANDTDTYRRFMIGFRTVLKVDSGRDVSREVYDTFTNL